jgi:hypothetical protein
MQRINKIHPVLLLLLRSVVVIGIYIYGYHVGQNEVNKNDEGKEASKAVTSCTPVECAANNNEILVSDLKAESSVSTAGYGDDVGLANSLGIASFYGAWLPASGGEMGNPVNSVYIICHRNQKICDIAQADVVFGDVLSNTISYFEITKWSNDGEIVAINNSDCEDLVLTADVKTQQVILTESREKSLNNPSCTQDVNAMVLKLGSRGY